MSGGIGCTCTPKNRTTWVVVQRRCNHSAFSGYHYTLSEYSEVACTRCRRRWRTKAAYVNSLPDGTDP